MDVHSVQDQSIQSQIDKLKQEYVKPKPVQPFVDPIKEFSRASQAESMVRNWLTYSLEDRKRLVRDTMKFVPRFKGDPRDGRLPESEKDFEIRQLERWRSLCVVLQEESRTRTVGGTTTQGSVEVAIGALKQLFYAHDWKTKPLGEPPKIE